MAIAQTKFITAYGPKTKYRTSMDGEKTRTHQSGKDECDINLLMAKYVKTGVLDHQKEHGESYGFCTSMDLLEALSTVQKANEMFDDLPAQVRTKFNNDAGEFLDFTADPDNQAELVKMGLGESPQEQTPVVEVKTEAGTAEVKGETAGQEAPAAS